MFFHLSEALFHFSTLKCAHNTAKNKALGSLLGAWRCLAYTKRDLTVCPPSWRSHTTERHPMNPWRLPGNILPGLGRILERVYGRDVWPYRPLFQQSRDSSEHVR
jgi:hypothetical protein